MLLPHEVKTEVEVIFEDKSSTEFDVLSIPREGEYLDLELEHTKGLFIVEKVVHKIFTPKGKNDKLHYVTLYVKEEA